MWADKYIIQSCQACLAVSISYDYNFGICLLEICNVVVRKGNSRTVFTDLCTHV